MNCLEFRQALLAEPSSLDEDLKQHLHDCQACTQFASSMSDFEHQLKKSVNVELPEGLSSRILLRQRLATQQQRSRRRGGWMALAASLVIGIMVMLGFDYQTADATLEHVVLQHVNDELHHLKDDYDLDITKLNLVLRNYGAEVDSLSGRRIHYAGACQIRRHQGAHLVVGSEQGPVTVLFMPGEFVDARKPLKDKRFQGVIVPVENGSMAILGEDPKEVGRLEREFVSQLRVIS